MAVQRSCVARGALVGVLLACACQEPPTPPRAAAAPSDPFVRTSQGRFMLDGRPFRFTGVNTYSLLSAPPGTDGYACGTRHSDEDLETLLWDVKAMGGSVIRLHVFQSFTGGGKDLSRLDLVIAKANRLGLKLILTLENQWEACTEGGYKDADWYREGYRHPYGSYGLSYRDYAAMLASRYRDEPAILMWQLMNEAEAKTSDGRADPDALLLFATDMGAVIALRDPNHLVSLGTIGGDQPGTAGDAYRRIAGVPWIHVVEVHDYGAESDSLPRATRRCLRIAAETGKPCFIGEIGISARQRIGRQKRADFVGRKLDAAWVSGVGGVLIWSFRAGDGVHMDIDTGDPIIPKLKAFSERAQDRLP